MKQCLEYQFIKGSSSKAYQYYRLTMICCKAIISLASLLGVEVCFNCKTLFSSVQLYLSSTAMRMPLGDQATVYTAPVCPR
jgi:hypothetical protein